MLIEKKTLFALFPIGDVFLQTYAISNQKKLQLPDTTQMKDLSKGFTGVTNFNPFFLLYAYLWLKRKVFKIRHFLCPQGYLPNGRRQRHSVPTEVHSVFEGIFFVCLVIGTFVNE